MKKQILLGALAFVLFASVSAQSVDTPVYLDDTKPVELRVEDALSRMTLEEKIAMIHVSLSSVLPVFPAWVFLRSGVLTDLMVFVRRFCGTNGIRPDGQTIHVLHFRH